MLTLKICLKMTSYQESLMFSEYPAWFSYAENMVLKTTMMISLSQLKGPEQRLRMITRQKRWLRKHILIKMNKRRLHYPLNKLKKVKQPKLSQQKLRLKCKLTFKPTKRHQLQLQQQRHKKLNQLLLNQHKQLQHRLKSNLPEQLLQSFKLSQQLIKINRHQLTLCQLQVPLMPENYFLRKFHCFCALS